MADFPISAYLPRLLLARGEEDARRWTVEGTLVFVDISGFTKLSDQLARRGREGGEDLVRTLVRIFSVLLSASDDGGDVVKFGGDAMAVLYTGPDHARRACHAAGVMQGVMAVIGDVELTGARARLRMSIGIHSGSFHLMLVGSRQTDLLALGTDVTRTLELEAAAESREVLVSPRTAEQLRPAELGARKGPGVLLRRVRQQVSTGSQILFAAPDDERLWRYLPLPFQRRADVLTGHSDHRRAGIGFVAVTGLDPILRVDPGRVHERLEALAAAVHEAAADTGVTVLDTDVAKDGFKYLLCAGAPTSVEDPEGRIIRALLRTVAADTGLRVQAGCTSGRVFAGTVGAPFRSSYTAMGDTTNLAARLCAAAAPGEVLAHEPMLRRSLTDFEQAAPRQLLLKGKPDPEPAVPVRAVAGQRGRAMDQVAFVGREKELDAIAASYSGLGAGSGAVVQVVGEPGVGKSRLANVALGALGHPLWWFSADPYGAQVPYSTLRVVLRRLLGLPADSSPQERAARLAGFTAEQCPELLPWLPLFGPVLGATLPPTPEVTALAEQFRIQRMHESLRTLLARLLPGPAALVLDDAHWMDPASADAFEHVLADLAGLPWAVLLTRRDLTAGLHGSEDLATTEVLLQPLDDGTAQALLTRQSRMLLPDEAEAIVQRAGGNPYFLLQLAGSGVEELPDTVEELVGIRIDTLDPLDRDLLRNASVIGSRFSPELFEAATGDGHLREALSGREIGEYLTLRGDEAVFTREVYREVAYAQLTFRGRQQLHRHAALAIERAPGLAGTARLPMLSLHYSRARMWPEAFAASREAAQAAASAFAHDQAAGFLRRALSAARHLDIHAEEIAAIHAALADSCQVVGRFEEAVASYGRAMRLTTDLPTRVELSVKSGRVLDQSGQGARARRMYGRARRLALGAPEGVPAILLAELDLAESASHFLLGRHARASALAERAWDCVAALQASTRALRARARAAFLYDSAAGWAQGAAGTRFGELPLRIYEELGDWYFAGLACNNLGVTACAQGRWGDAVRYYERGMTLSARAGDRLHETFMTMNLAEIRGLQGRTEEAEAALRSARRTFRAMGATVGAIAADLMLAAVLLRQGHLAGCRALLEAARQEAAGIGDTHDAHEAATLELDLLLAEGRPPDVVALAPQLLAEDLEPVARARVLRDLGRAHERLGQRRQARAVLTRALHVARSADAAYEVALAQAALADLGGRDVTELRRAAEETLAGLGVVAV